MVRFQQETFNRTFRQQAKSNRQMRTEMFWLLPPSPRICCERTRILFGCPQTSATACKHTANYTLEKNRDTPGVKNKHWWLSFVMNKSSRVN